MFFYNTMSSVSHDTQLTISIAARRGMQLDKDYISAIHDISVAPFAMKHGY